MRSFEWEMHMLHHVIWLTDRRHAVDYGTGFCEGEDYYAS
jgi:hypothetical protein